MNPPSGSSESPRFRRTRQFTEVITWEDTHRHELHKVVQARLMKRYNGINLTDVILNGFDATNDTADEMICFEGTTLAEWRAAMRGSTKTQLEDGIQPHSPVQFQAPALAVYLRQDVRVAAGDERTGLYRLHPGVISLEDLPPAMHELGSLPLDELTGNEELMSAWARSMGEFYVPRGNHTVSQARRGVFLDQTRF